MEIPKKLKPKNPFLTLQPLYTNPTTGLGFKTASMELGLQGNYGKKKEWTLKPHIGYNYNAPAGKTALTGGLDASYKGMVNPSRTGNAVVNLGVGYNSDAKRLKGAVLGWDAGYQFHFGAKNRRKGEIKPGKFAGSLMPYAGGNAEDALMYGGRGDFEWRPKFGNKAPFTVFGGANLNFAPATGKVKEVEDTATIYEEGDVSGANSPITPGGWKDNSSEGVKFKPTFGAHLGVKMPLSRIKENLPSFNRQPISYPVDPLPLQGDTTYAQRLPELSPGGKSLLGTYDETADEFRARRNEWGKPILKVDPRYINQDIRSSELQEFPWQNKSYIPSEDSDDGYALGGAIRTMAEGGSGCLEGYVWDGKNCIKQWGPTTITKKENNKPASKENADIKNLMEIGKKSLPKTQIPIKPTQPKNISFKGDVTNDILNNYIYNHKDQLVDNVAEFFDASGLTSWDDAYRAKQAWNQSGNTLPTLEQSVNMFGAVPILGKLSKLKYLTNSSKINNSLKIINPIYKYFPWQEVLNKSDAVKDTYEDNIKKYGGPLNLMANGGDPKATRTLFQPGTYNPNEIAGSMLNLPEATKSAEAPMWVEFANEYEKKNSKQAFIDGKKRDYLKQNKNLNAMAGNNMDYFPEKVAQNFADEYEYKKNNYVTKKIAKEKDFNPRKRGEWVAELSPGERRAVENSRYGSKLQANLWDRSLAGLKNIGSYIDPDLGKIDVPGLTKAEQAEIQNSKLGALEIFAPMDLQGLATANWISNRGLSTGSNYKELPSGLSGESMSNVSPTDAMAFNLASYAGLEAIPELAVNVAKLGYKGAKAAGKTYNKVATGNSRLTDFNFPAWKLEKPTGSMSGATENSRSYIAKTNTDRGAKILSKFGKGMNFTPDEWAEMEALTKSGATDFSKSDIPISRIPLYYNRSERAIKEAEALNKLKLWQKFSTPSEKSIRTWSAGIPEGYSPERLARSTPEQKIRLVIPSRYTKDLGDNFTAMPYDDTRVDFIYPKDDRGAIKAGQFNTNASLENELMGNIPEGFIKIGSSNEGGYNNIIVKPIGKKSKGIGSKISNLALNYGKDVVGSTKHYGKIGLPKYKNVYRVEHGNFNQAAIDNDLTGKWFADNPGEAAWYAENLKDPTTGDVINSFAQSAPTRVMQERLPMYKVEQQFGEGMPEEAKTFFSRGRGNLTNEELDHLLGEGASERFRTGKYTDFDRNALESAPFLFNKAEGILPADLVNKIRSTNSQSIFDTGRSQTFGNQGDAIDYLRQEKLKQKSPLKKYSPLKNGGSLAPNIPTYYQSQGTPIYRDTTALPFAEGGDLDGPGDPMPGKPKLPKLSTNDMTAYIYDTVVKLIEEAKASGKIKEGEDLNAMGVTAQILLESGNGKSGLTQKYNNFGGIKANDSYIKRGGKYVGMNASGENVKSKWRIYDTPEEGLRDQISFYLDNPRYRKAGVLTAKTAQEHAQRVQNAGYAGNEKKYARQVMQMANSIPNRIKKSDPAKLQTFVTSYAPAQPAVNPVMPVQPMQPVGPIAPPVQPAQPINVVNAPIKTQVVPTPVVATAPGGVMTNSALQAQTTANNAMMTSALNNVTNSNINSNIASQQNLISPELITIQQGDYQEKYAPEYQMPGYNVERPGIYMRAHHSGQLIPHARPTFTTVEKPGMINKAIQNFTGYNPSYSEGFTDEEGNYIPGEFENAQTENRRVNFQGASSLKDFKAQKEYNKAYDTYEQEQQVENPLTDTYSKGLRNGGFLASGYGSSLDEYYANGGQMKYTMYDVFENGTYYGKGGQMIKRADGSYSPRGLWDNIRANAGSGKAPTEEMLAQERKINQKKYGGPLTRFYPSNIQEY